MNMTSLPAWRDVEAAADRIRSHIQPTPQVFLSRLSALLDLSIWGKLEIFQHTGSFKERGALNALMLLTKEQAEKGVIAMSAGNHAQGLAYHARRLNIPATIVMPEGTPFTKIERTRADHANVILYGKTLSEAYDFALEKSNNDHLTFIHPYDDPAIIAGQGTIASEMLAAQPDLDCLVVPIGGGGLISGIALAARHLKPDIRIIGVQSALYPAMKQVLTHESVETYGLTVAEGIAVKYPGLLTRQIVGRDVDEIVLVSESSLEIAIYELTRTAKIVTEGAGAAAIAALIEHHHLFQGKKVGAVICGANIDERLYANLLLRGLVRDGRVARLRIELADQPGSLAKVATIIGDHGGNIVEVQHQRLFQDVPAKITTIDIVMETMGRQHGKEVVMALESAGFPCHLIAHSG